MSLFKELKRRNVFRVGIAYVVGAWLLAQIADLVLDVIGAPDIVLRSLVALLALGLLPAVIVAWAFEMTPEGVKKESEIDRSESVTAHTAKKLDLVTIGLLIAAVAFVVVMRYLPDSESVPTIVAGTETSGQAEKDSSPGAGIEQQDPAAVSANEKSIAVLPFANRSNQNDDLFFTDGIHDDLLTQLAKIHDLTVISRTSVMEYRDTNKNLRQIGAELNVATILEGGIQKVGDRVRINAQLIEVATDKHLWAETFDRELTAENIFDIQSEIAREIVGAVAIELTPEEENLLAETPTQNLAAYEAYLRAREVIFGANYARSQEEDAQPWLEKAIALDPDYSQAYALLANIYGQLYWRGIDTSDALLEKLRFTIDKALSLNPRSPTALRARANYLYRIENSYQESLDLLEQALEEAPGDVDLHGDRALSLRRLGRWQDSVDSFAGALELDPSNRFYHSLMLETMANSFKWQDIIDNSVPLEDADPNDLDIQVTRAFAQFNLSGDLEPMEQVFARMYPVDSTNYVAWSARVHWLKRDPDAAIHVLNSPTWLEAARSSNILFREYELANAYRLKGETDKARELYEYQASQAAQISSSALQVKVYGGINAAISLARLERFDEALALISKLVEEASLQKDAMLWGAILSGGAMVKGLAGDQEGAIDELEIALTTPSGFAITVWDLYYDPNWDFMRENSRFVGLATPEISIRTLEN
jgi:TolB-like protein/Flp pilus assembly protein TadD